MKSKLLKLAVLVVCISVEFVSGQNKTTKRPNIIIINADDLGYGDPSCYGGELFETPNIDRLAKQGIQFTNGYVSSSVCGPSRLGLLSGCYQTRFGIQWNHDTFGLPGQKGKNRKATVPTDHRYINQAFSEAGYATAMAGKIGIPTYPKTTFDQEFSLTSAGCNYFPDKTGGYGGVDGHPKPKGGWTMIQWGPDRKGEEYITDRVGRQCLEFIEDNKDKENPFFFYLAFNAPHTPLQAKKVDRKRVKNIKSESMKLYAAMVLAIDDNVGRILDYLDTEGLRENTIVVFLSDNGPMNPIHFEEPTWWPDDSPYHIMGQRGGLSGYKGIFREAGIRIPYIMSWPGHLDQNVKYEKTVSTLDLYPTLCSAANVKLPKNTHLDGVNILPFLQGGYANEEPHDYLYWYANRMGAVRSGKWKLYIEDNKHYLFDLEKDLSETTNVSHENPEVMKEIFGAFIAHRNEMPPLRNPFIRPIDLPRDGVENLHPVDPR